MLAKKIAYNTIISAGSRILGTIIALVTIGFVTRYLGQNGFGNYSTILAFLYVFSVLADLGLYSIALREISKDGVDESRIISQAFSFRFWIGLLIFGLGALAVWFFPYPIEIKIGAGVGAVGFWFLSSAQVLMAVFQKYLKTERAALAELIGRAAQLGLVVFFVWKNSGFLSIVLTVSLGALINFLLIYFFVQKYVSVKIKWDIAGWKKILKESYPLAVSAVFVMIYFKLDTVMLSLMKPAEDVGIYGVAYKILENLIFFPALFVGLIMPLLSRHALAKQEEFKRVAQKTLEILLIFAAPLAIGGAILSKPIIRIIAGQGFGASSDVLVILIFATAIIFLGSLFSGMIIALERQRSLAKIYGLGAIFNFAANLILIPRFSYLGAASSTLLTEILVTTLMVVVIKKTINYFPDFKLLFKIFLASLVMAAGLYFFGQASLILLLIIGPALYFTSLFAVRGISLKEILALIKPGKEMGSW
jgi:O-antigen/teichoic acid export membrane protein